MERAMRGLHVIVLATESRLQQQQRIYVVVLWARCTSEVQVSLLTNNSLLRLRLALHFICLC